MKRIAIIGAGIAGLSAAVRLQKAGFQTTVFEKNYQPGGKMHRLEINGYSFDVGPTLVMMPEVYREIFESCGKNPDDYIPMESLHPLYDVYFKDKSEYRHYSIDNDMEKLSVIFESKGPENWQGFLSYMDNIYRRYQVALKYFITKPFRHKRDFYNLKIINQALKLKTFDSADHMMKKFIPDRDLRQMLSFQTLYIGVSPQKGPSLYNIIPMIELLYGVHFLKGGMHSMAKALARLFQELGGEIRYGTKVEKIQFEQGKVKGVWINNSVEDFDAAVCNADFPYAMKELVRDDKTRGKYDDKRIDKMDYSCSCLLFYWGVKDKYKLEPHTFVVSEDLDHNLEQIFDGSLIDDPSVYLHIPSQVDPSMAPEGKSSFYVLIPVSELGTARYPYNEDNISYYREKALEALEKLPGLSNLRDAIEVESIYKPDDFEKEFNAYRGATFGLQPSLRQSNHMRPQSKCTGCEGLYFCGSSTHPGAGVPIVMESGRICAEELMRDEGLI